MLAFILSLKFCLLRWINIGRKIKERSKSLSIMSSLIQDVVHIVQCLDVTVELIAFGHTERHQFY